MTRPEKDQWLAGVGCLAAFPPDRTPVVHIDGLTGIEITSAGDRHYDIWDASEPPLAPIGAWLSLDETIALLTAGGGRA